MAEAQQATGLLSARHLPLTSAGNKLTRPLNDLSFKARRPQESPIVEVSVREGRGIKTRPGQNEDSPELHEVINMVVDDPEHQSLSVRLKDEDGLVAKARGLCHPALTLH